MTIEALRLDADLIDSELVIFARGEVDALSAPSLASVLGEIAARRGTVRLDCSGVTFMDSSGLHALACAAMSCRLVNGGVIVQNPSAVVQRLLHLTGMHGVLSIVTSDSSGRNQADTVPSNFGSSENMTVCHVRVVPSR